MNLSTLLVSTTALVNVLTVQGFTAPIQSRSTTIQSLRRHATLAAPSINGDTETSTTESAAPNDEIANNIRLNVFEKARTVTSVCTSATLCTVSTHDGIQGAPFGSFVDYVLDDSGNPILLMNEMSMHTMNIEQQQQKTAGDNALVTLFTQLGSDTAASKKGQDVSRCSLTCKVEKLDPDTVPDMDVIRMRYSLTHAYADQVMDSPKFAFYRLLPETIYYVGGFGVMSRWVNVDEYRAAAPDILAKEASEIVSKLNREHRDDLARTANHILMVENLENCRVSSVDRLGFDMRVTRRQGTRRNKLETDEFRVGFRIPVQSTEDAKSEVLKVFQEAWEKANDIQWDDEEPGSTIPVLKIAADSLE